MGIAPSGYEKKINRSIDFNVTSSDNFFDYALFSLHSNLNKTTNNRVDTFNKQLFQILLKQEMKWESFNFNFINKKYCFCNGEYVFYQEEAKYCIHSNKINPLHYIGISPVIDVLAAVLSNEQNYKDIISCNKKAEIREELNGDSKIFDINSGLILKLARINGYYSLADICLSVVCWTDKFELENGTSICVVLASTSEIAFERRTKEKNLIPIAAWICHFPLHNSIFQPVVDVLNSLFFDKNEVTFYQYSIDTGKLQQKKFNNTIKVICIGLNNDKGMDLDVFNMKPSGYGSCVSCLILGEYSGNCVHFPFRGIFWPKRTEQWATECERIRLFLNNNCYGAHYGISTWSGLNQFDLFSVLHIDDPMHDFVGIIEVLYNFISEEEKKNLEI